MWDYFYYICHKTQANVGWYTMTSYHWRKGLKQTAAYRKTWPKILPPARMRLQICNPPKWRRGDLKKLWIFDLMDMFYITPPKFNIDRSLKWWLEDYFPFGDSLFSGGYVKLHVGMYWGLAKSCNSGHIICSCLRTEPFNLHHHLLQCLLQSSFRSCTKKRIGKRESFVTVFVSRAN